MEKRKAEGCDEDRRPTFLAYSSKQKAKTLVANVAQEQGLSGFQAYACAWRCH